MHFLVKRCTSIIFIYLYVIKIDWPQKKIIHSGLSVSVSGVTGEFLVGSYERESYINDFKENSIRKHLQIGTILCKC